jgi:hypothetical protein
VPVVRGTDASLTLGVNLGLMGYDKNLSGFTVGQGGYFSPQRFTALTFPLDWQGRDGRLSWRLNASIGVQSFREDPSPFNAATGLGSFSATSSSHRGLAYNVAAIVEYRVASKLYLGGALGFNNARDYRQVTGSAYLRYAFDDGGGAPTGLALRPLLSPYTPFP